MIETTSEDCEQAPPAFAKSPELSRSQLLCMARGFTLIFWGLLITLVLFFANAFFEIFNSVRIPAYVIGSAIVALGLFGLHGAERISRAWVRRTRVVLFLVMLQIYFAPFVAWWQATPYVSMLLVNCLCLILAGMLSLFYINLLVAESVRRMDAGAAGTGSGLFAAAVFLLMIVPFSIVVGPPVVAAIYHRTSFYSEMWSMINKVPAWAYALVALPCALTLVAAWKAKDRCYRKFLAGN